MICSYCKNARIENEAPCPHCGAPSPLLQVSQAGQWRPGNGESVAWNNEPTNGASYQSSYWQKDASFNTGNQQVGQQDFAPSSFRQPSGQLNFPTATSSFRQPSGQLNFPAPSFGSPSGQLNFPTTPTREPAADVYNPMPFWQSTDQQTPVEQEQSFLPVPYQNGMDLQAEG